MSEFNMFFSNIFRGELNESWTSVFCFNQLVPLYEKQKQTLEAVYQMDLIIHRWKFSKPKSNIYTSSAYSIPYRDKNYGYFIYKWISSTKKNSQVNNIFSVYSRYSSGVLHWTDRTFPGSWPKPRHHQSFHWTLENSSVSGMAMTGWYARGQSVDNLRERRPFHLFRSSLGSKPRVNRSVLGCLPDPQPVPLQLTHRA